MDEMRGNAYIDAFQRELRNELTPVIAVMAIICVLGIAGNSFTIAFYGFVARRTPTIFLITVLACVDLLVCVLIIAQVTEMAVNVKYTSAAACHILHFLGHWVIVTSAIMLWFIAIDRYRHVCCPFKGQVTQTMAKRIVVAIFIFTFIISVRDFVNFDIIEFPLEDHESNTTVPLAHYCTTREDPTFKVNVTFWHSLDAFLIIVVLVTLCVTYGRIVWVIKTGTLVLDTENKETNDCNSNEQGSGLENHSSTPGNTYVDDVANNINHTSVGNDQRVPTHSGRSKVKTTERSITFMMLVVSVVFCVCFLPYFIVKIGVRSFKSASQLELGVGIQFAIRLPYVNSFANPLVFCCFNPQFRRFITETVLRLRSVPKQTSTTMSNASPSPLSP